MNAWFVSVSKKLCFDKYLVSFISKNTVYHQCHLIAYQISDISVQSLSWAIIEFCKDTDQSIFHPIFYAVSFFEAEVFLPLNYKIVLKENNSFPELEIPWREIIVDLEDSIEEIRSDENLDPNFFFAKLEQMLRERCP